jgi:SAM-dependent methyltransferase
MNARLKEILKKVSALGLEINHALDDGVSIFGLNLSRARASYDIRSAAALKRALILGAHSVLDVGSGGGEHAVAFAKAGAKVTCVDFGTSIYAERMQPNSGIDVVHADFSKWNPSQKFDLVWASHVLEHQRNPGSFIEKLIDCCASDGYVVITVPVPHRRLWGGHLSLWTPGILAYNIVMCGVDISGAQVFYGYRETSIIFKPLRFVLPDLTFDNGDLDVLAKYLPKFVRENSDPWV